MSSFTIKPAVRQARKARIALDGPSGSGKTWTALAFGSVLGSRMVVIDTERASATLYAGSGQGEFTFDHLDMPSYEPDTLIAALHQCAGAGYDVVVIDSLTHFWSGVGGVLEQVDYAAKRKTSGNTFAAWKDVRPMERRLMDAMTSYPGHVIVTMRTKTEWVIVENDRGRKEPKKIGMKPEQREGIEYEFDLVGSLDIEHTFVVTKSRCSILADAVVPKPDGQVAATLRDWLASGAPGAQTPAMPPPGGLFSDEYRANGAGHHPNGAANGNGKPPQYGRDQADWLAWMRSQIGVAGDAATLRNLWAVVGEARDQGKCPPPEVDRLADEIKARHAWLGQEIGGDGARELDRRLAGYGVQDKDARRALMWHWLGRCAGSATRITRTEAALIGQRIDGLAAMNTAARDRVLGSEVTEATARDWDPETGQEIVRAPDGTAHPDGTFSPAEPQPGDAGSQWADPAEVA